MMTEQKHQHDVLSARHMALAAGSSDILKNVSGYGDTATLQWLEQATEVTVPGRAIALFSDILQYMAEGKDIAVMPLDKELTTQQAADMLQVSRPFLIDHILQAGKLRFHKTGNRRKILLQDVITYRKQQQQASRKILAELAEQSQASDMLG
ncbi:MAG: helix-turn-helix domain-containing protein [Pseudomonadota bacterium]